MPGGDAENQEGVVEPGQEDEGDGQPIQDVRTDRQLFLALAKLQKEVQEQEDHESVDTRFQPDQ